MRKTSTYARKQRQRGITFNGAEWANTIQRCRPYSEEPVVPGWNVGGTLGASDTAELLVRGAYTTIKEGRADSKDSIEYDRLIEAIGVATIRAIQIGGEDVETNTALQILHAATAAMRRVAARYEATKRWGFDGPAIEEVAAGVDAYGVILQRSSPAQMTAAYEARMAILEAQGKLK